MNGEAVTKLASSEARNRMQFAISRASAMRFSGFDAAYSSRSAAGSGDMPRNRSVSGVSTTPGHTQLARMPRGATSSASARVNISSAAFDAQYAAAFGRGAIPLAEPTVTTDPPSESRGRAARQSWKTPVTLTANTSFHSSSEVSATGGSSGWSTPATQTTMSSAP